MTTAPAPARRGEARRGEASQPGHADMIRSSYIENLKPGGP